MIRKAVWLMLAPFLWAQPGGVEGTWQGTLHAGAISLRIGLHVGRDANGELVSKLDSIDQGAMGLPVHVTTFHEGKLHLELPNLHATFDGTLSADGREIGGTFTQGAPMPLTFRRVAQIETLKRPQTPKPPFPYNAEDVAYDSHGGIRLAGTLTFPRGAGPFPAALLITGSGPQDRDETLFGHKPFLVIADALTRRGIAVLRLDDRGVGKSTGSSTQATLDDMAGDVLAGVQYLRGRKEIDGGRIGLIGHSEGGIVGPLAASRDPRIAFVVMLAGTGVTGEQVLYLQGELISRSAGAGAEAIAQNHEVQKMILDALRESKDEKDAIEKMKAGWEKMKAAAPEDRRRQMIAREQAVFAQFTAITSPELRSFVFHDPAATLRKLKMPVLAMNGSRDLQVPPQQNLPAIAGALSAGANQDFTIAELPGLNHLFQHCTDCTVAEYSKLEETFSPAALELLGDWIESHTRVRP
jgi:fermentation-respiration switch protein FrsA (DUF1100 family)